MDWLRSANIGYKTAWIEMRVQKLRSSLSVLGMVFGVASMVAMLSLIGGIQSYVGEKMGRWSASIWITARSGPVSGLDPAWSRSSGLRRSDGEFLETNAPGVRRFVDEIVRVVPSVHRGRSDSLRVLALARPGMDEEFKDLSVDAGAPLTGTQIEAGDRACLVSADLIPRLLGNAQQESGGSGIVGGTLYLQGEGFSIQGTYRPHEGDLPNWKTKETVIIPLQAMRKYLTGFDPEEQALEVSMANSRDRDRLADGMAVYLKRRHRGAVDFEYSGSQWLSDITKTLGNLTTLMGIVSFISLSIGGLGIMNIMLSGLSERVQEIGIRRAIGAKPSHIFIQFLSESMTLSIAGGVIGTLLGASVLIFKDAIKKSSDGAIVPTLIPAHILLVFGVMVFMGVLFGLYPALKASKMNPIDALRYE